MTKDHDDADDAATVPFTRRPGAQLPQPEQVILSGSGGLAVCHHQDERCVDEGDYFVIYCAVAGCGQRKAGYSVAYVKRYRLLLEALRQREAAG
jgi:hypothetical protein